MKTMRGSNHTGMRQFNERTVLRAIRHEGAIPKADLARLTQLSSQTVSIIVNRLLEDGLLIKQDRIRGKIGQPSVPLAINPDGAYSIGLQVGRRSLEVVVTDFLGQMRHQWQHNYPYPSPTEVLPKIKEGLKLMQKRMGAEAWKRAVGIGLSAPLAMHQWGDLMGKKAQKAMVDWEHIDLVQEVQAMSALPVEFAKDTTAACVAELVQGLGRDVPNFLYVYVGTFVGGGLVMDGHIVNGPRGNAGAIGSMPIGLPPLGTRANANTPAQLLQLASGWQLEQALMVAGHDPLLVQQNAIMSPEFSAFTQPWLSQAAKALAMSATSAAALLDLDAIIMDGSLNPKLLQALIQQTEASLAQFSFDGIHQPQILAGRVGSHARALGGALLPLHAQFFPDKDIFLKQDELG
ncbi:serine/threonine protein kinase [Limnohabitans sp. TS-CS-82]|uniref:ROK family transcriptional regulator n=1 Tax=Limnohabitans sp. TS-CS-82 TaxID=2094193 RepID=UPI000CF2B059|nr:ROK family transcriptional regulator [Limnohabitans sp. TS-CS-82]PQA84034.1 serine/threonine protein kinase [Limnohabitans sp. TS-CS-82]